VIPVAGKVQTENWGPEALKVSRLRRRQLIDKDLVERIELSNYNRRPVDVSLLFRHDADFRPDPVGQPTIPAAAKLPANGRIGHLE
jgi:hypothetical protein